eukprot:COSAG03_NODE_3941_length_1750_cov_1.251816_1_plen_157_part_00
MLRGAPRSNTSGVYIDQIASANAEACYDSQRGKAGGGSAWANGYRNALTKAVAAVGPGKVIISESNSEAYLGSLHAFLAIYGWSQCTTVPAFQAVYGGYAVNVGNDGWTDNVVTERTTFAQQVRAGAGCSCAAPPPPPPPLPPLSLSLSLSLCVCV